jgi:hypothetical protein
VIDNLTPEGEDEALVSHPTRRAGSRRPAIVKEAMMAELTNLASKLGEVTGLAMAAQVATGKVIKLLAASEAPNEFE